MSDSEDPIHELSTERIDHLCECVPGIRMVVVITPRGPIGPRPEDDWHEIRPVYAVRTTVVRVYTKKSRTYRNGNRMTVRELLADGWALTDREVRTEPMTVTADYGITPPDMLACNNTVERVFLCPWPADQDEERLRPDIEEMKAGKWNGHHVAVPN